MKDHEGKTVIAYRDEEIGFADAWMLRVADAGTDIDDRELYHEFPTGHVALNDELADDKLPKLRSLDIDPSRMSSSSIGALSCLPHLRSAAIHGYRECNKPLRALLQNPTLCELKVECGEVSNVTLECVEHAKNLERLTIRPAGRSAPLKHIIRSAAKAPALTRLTCYITAASEFNDLGNLARRGKLQELILSVEAIESEHLALLKSATGLKRLEFHGNLTDEAILDLPLCLD